MDRPTPQRPGPVPDADETQPTAGPATAPLSSFERSNEPGEGDKTTAPRWRWLAVLPAVLILGLFGWKLVSQSPGGGQPGVNAVGQAAQFKPRPVPDIALRTWEGDTLRPAQMRGQLLVLNFWGSWCLPCRQEAPDLEAAWRRAQARGVAFIGVNEWDAESDARAFMREFGVSYVNAPDPTGQLAVELGVTGIPETYLVDRTGQLVRRWIGPIGQQKLLDIIAEVDTAGRGGNE